MTKLKTPFVAGFFEDPQAFVHAAEQSSQRGWHTLHQGVMPYPVHAAFAALRIRRSYLGRPVLFLLLLGAFLGFIMQWWMLAIDYPINISGKPYNSWPAFVVIVFECGVLLGGVCNLLLLLFVYCKLVPDPVTRSIKSRLTDDQFCLAIPVGADGRDEEALHRFFQEQHADQVELCSSELREPTQPVGNPFTTEAGASQA